MAGELAGMRALATARMTGVSRKEVVARTRVTRWTITEAQIAELKERAAAQVTKTAMDETVSVDQYRECLLAGLDLFAQTGFLADALLHIEQRFIQTTDRIQSDLYKWDL